MMILVDGGWPREPRKDLRKMDTLNWNWIGRATVLGTLLLATLTAAIA